MGRRNLAWPHNNMRPAPAGVATIQRIWETEDGIMLAWGITVPTDATTGYAKGCIFIHTDGSAGTMLYVNEGTGTSCNFDPVATQGSVDSVINGIDDDETAGTAAGAGPSPLIWNDSKWFEAQLDPTVGFSYFDDFLGPIDVTTGDGWTLTQSNSTGTISGLATDQGGVLVITDGGSTEDDSLNAQLKNCLFKPAAGVTIRFEARLNMTDATQQWFVGLAGVQTAILGSGAIDDTVDKCGFYHQHDSTDNKMSAISSRTSSEEIDADVAANADNTYVKIGFVINGLTSVTWYVNGVSVGSVVDANDIPNAVMCLTLFAGYQGASSATHIDWIRILQEGGRAT